MNLKPLQFVLGSSLAIYGSVQLLCGWYYTDISKREAAAVGVIRHVSDGWRHTIYEYSFQLGNKVIQGYDVVCETAFTYPCKVDTPVRVYYDQSNPAKNMLDEYGAQSRRSFHLARWMIPFGIILFLWLYFQSRIAGDTDSKDESDDGPDENDLEIPHVVPNEEI